MLEGTWGRVGHEEGEHHGQDQDDEPYRCPQGEEGEEVGLEIRLRRHMHIQII